MSQALTFQIPIGTGNEKGQEIVQKKSFLEHDKALANGGLAVRRAIR